MALLGSNGSARMDPIYKWVPGFNRSSRPAVIVDTPFVERVVGTDWCGYTIVTGTGTTFADVDSPGPGSVGVKRFTGTAATFAGSGIRQAIEALSANGFGGGREFAWVCRFKCPGGVPVVTDRDYGVHAGLCTQEAGIAEPDDGVYMFYSKAVSKWTIKAARAGSRTSFTTSVDWEDVFHTIGFHTLGDASAIVPYVDSVPGASITSNIQPADGLQSSFFADSLGASTADLVIDIDHIAWGYTL